MNASTGIQLLQETVPREGIRFFQGLPAGVELSIRENTDYQLFFVINFTKKRLPVYLSKPYPSALSGEIKKFYLLLEPFGLMFSNCRRLKY
jgi:hypothetical protein